MLYLFLFLLILLLYVIIFLINIKVALEYVRNEQDEWFRLSFYVRAGNIRYEYEIPLGRPRKDKNGFRLVKERGRPAGAGRDGRDELSPMDIYRKFISVRTYLKDHAKLIKDIRTYLNRKNIHAELKIKIRQGTGDAAQTGLICGLLWSAAGIFITYISRFLRLSGNDIHVIPCFDKAVFEVEARCIFHVKLVHIIVVLKKIYTSKYMIKLKSKKMIGGEISG